MISCQRAVSQPPDAQGKAYPDGHLETAHTIDDIGPVCDRVAEAVVAAGYAGYEGFTVRLALEEALINAIKHGHQGDPTKTARVRYSITHEQILVSVEDEGHGFNPNQVADPLEPENLDRATGRGLLWLMRHYMSWIKYNERGNRVTLCKRRSH